MRARAEDASRLAELVGIVWPEHSREELTKIVGEYIGSDNSAVFYACADGQAVGVALCALRHDYVEGCETSPVGYLEGIVVREAYRHRAVARALLSECEQWAREKGCTEFASDCELTNAASLRFHLSVGFREENRIICFKKMLVSYREANAAEAGRINGLFVGDPDDQSLGGTVGHPELLRERPVES